MLIALSKIVVVPFYPLGFALALMAASLVLFHFRKTRAGVGFIIGTAIVLYLFSAGPLPYWLVRSLERQYAPTEMFPQTSAIVLLTGGETAKAPPRLFDEVNEAGDRILYAGRLMAVNAAPRCIITGGNIGFLRTIEGSQAEAAAHLLANCKGVDTSRILLETQARNTYENGVFTKRLLDSLGLSPSIILVTSALHMPRSVAIFKKLGFTVFPAPVDYLADAPCQWKPVGFLPNVGALESATNALHELYGIIAYQLLGWL
jgi:uncharacterized SAM-binding protein YcdF (DUF218 family)